MNGEQIISNSVNVSMLSPIRRQPEWPKGAKDEVNWPKGPPARSQGPEGP